MGDRLGTPGVVGFFQFIFFLGPKLSREGPTITLKFETGSEKFNREQGWVKSEFDPTQRRDRQLRIFWILIQFFKEKGASADAGPHYQKLYGRVTTLVAIAEVSPSEVQCKGLTLEETPP